MTPTQGEHAQTEALRLADELEDSLESHDGSSLTARCQGIADEAAAELRRLHAQVAALTAAQEVPKCEFLAHGCDTPSYCQSVQRCTARDEKRAATAQPAAPAGAAPRDMERELEMTQQFNAGRQYEAGRIAARSAAAQAAPAADPMDWPLPCDVTVGHGTMCKGVSLRTLVARMKVLYEMATGNNADEVANRTHEQNSALAEAFRASIAAAPTPAAQADSQTTIFKYCLELLESFDYEDDEDSQSKAFFKAHLNVDWFFHVKNLLERAASAPADSVLEDAAEYFLEAQAALDNREGMGINAEPYEVLMHRRNRAWDDLEAAISKARKQGGA